MDINQAKRVLEEQAEKFIKYDNINSVGIGYKTVNGKKTNEIVIQFTVDRKVDLSTLESLGTTEIPTEFELDGETIATDVVQRVFKPSFQVLELDTKDIRKTRLNPVQPGISIGHKNISAGTFGCIVFGKNDAKPYILSNWHVLDGNSGQVGDSIVQPGRHDDPDISNNQVGKLVKSFLGKAGDCAIASIDERSFNQEILGLDVVPKKIAEVELDDLVIKSGRTTDITYGIVRRIHTSVRINYGGSVGSKTVKCFEVEPDPAFPAKDNEISMGGDSGSVWMVRDKDGIAKNIAAGLHFAGEGRTNPDEHALACYLDKVFDKLDIIL